MSGHNPKANTSDEMQNLLALLQDLPKVSAPTNFNASLQARIAQAKAESHEFADVTSLIKELPRVSAPADFDFRLRARIAQAKAEQQKTSGGWFAELFGRSFSWVQAGAAMAAVAIVISIGAYGVLRSGPETTVPNSLVAVAPVTGPVAGQPEVTTPAMGENKMPEAVSIGVAHNTTETTKRAIRTSLPAAPKASVTGDIKPAPPIAVPRAPEGMMATKTIIIKDRSGEARTVNLSEYNLGLQSANLRAAKPKAAAKPSFADNIY